MSEPIVSVSPDGVRCAPADPAFYENPYTVYRAMRSQGPCFFWQDYGYWCFPHYRHVNALLRDRRFGRQIEHLVSREELGLAPRPPHLAPFYEFESHSLLELEPPAHTRLRQLVNRAFVSRQVERLRASIQTLADELIDSFETDGNVELLARYAEAIPVIVIARILGVPENLSGQLLSWSHRMVAIYQHNRDAKIEAAAVDATVEFSAFMREYIETRRRSPADDLISLLIAVEQEGDRLSTDEMISTCILLLNAGHEATVHAIGNGVKAILESGQDPALLFETPQTTVATCEEILRFDAPLHLFTRYVLEDLEYAGRRFARGETIGLLLGAANRDPEQYPDPDAFDIRRGGQGHVTFGAGIHFCVGAPLARLEMQVALPALFRRLPRLRLDGPVRYADRYHFHGLSALNTSWS